MKSRKFLVPALLSALLVSPIYPVKAQMFTDIMFQRGSSSATLKGEIKGGEFHDYNLLAKAGQTMRVTVKSRGNLNFDILAPGRTETTLSKGNKNNTTVSVQLTVKGGHRVRIYQKDGAKHASKTIPFTVEISVQ